MGDQTDTDEVIRVQLPRDRGISVSIDLSEAETDALLAEARDRGLSLSRAARQIVLDALANRLATPTVTHD